MEKMTCDKYKYCDKTTTMKIKPRPTGSVTVQNLDTQFEVRYQNSKTLKIKMNKVTYFKFKKQNNLKNMLKY